MRIAISGKMGSGKSTAAQILQELYGFEIVSLATPLRRLVEIAKADKTEELAHAYMLRLFEHPDNATAAFQRYMALCYDCAEELAGPGKPRNFLQRLGTEVGRAIEPDVWVRELLKKTSFATVNIVCDDMRFLNEATLLRASGWELWRMEISEEIREVRLARLNGGVLPEDHNERQLHLSETELDGFENWDVVLAGCDEYEWLKGYIQEAVFRPRETQSPLSRAGKLEDICSAASATEISDSVCDGQQPQTETADLINQIQLVSGGTPAPRERQGGGGGE